MFILNKPQSCNLAKYNPKLLKMLKITILPYNILFGKDMIIQAILKAFVVDTELVLASDKALHAKNKLSKQLFHDIATYITFQSFERNKCCLL